MFNEYFYSTFSPMNRNIVKPDIDIVSDSTLSSLQFTVDVVQEVLASLDISKAVGPDNISPLVLKKCADILAPSLTRLFNKSLSLGQVPTDWKDANVIPVHKKGDKELVSNYRPISLLSIASKVMERCLYNAVFPKLYDKIHSLQHGFVKGRSTTTQLLEVYHQIGSVLDKGGQVDMLFLDFSKAFDSVPHILLTHKLQMFGFGGELLQWLNSYLTNRRQRVVVEGSLSEWRPVTSGVPQGSILGPLLFLLYINDLPSSATNSTVALFADDSKCFKEIRNTDDCVKLQYDITSMYNWSTTWRLYFNLSKCKVLRLTRSRKPVMYSYDMNGTSLELVSRMPDLGVTAQFDLKWNDHVVNTTARANSMLGFVKRTVGYTTSVDSRKSLYITLVRSMLEYSSPVWCPGSRKLISLIEGVQRRASKYILGAGHEHPDYKSRLTSLGMLPLSYRREAADVLLFVKSIGNIYDSDIVKYVSFSSRGTRSFRANMATPFRSKTQQFATSYIPRLISIWNGLDGNLRAMGRYVSQSSHITTFKRQLLKYLHNRFTHLYNTDTPCTWTSFCSCSTCFATRAR